MSDFGYFMIFLYITVICATVEFCRRKSNG